jgi:uncharacterized protein (DUF1501 family)
MQIVDTKHTSAADEKARAANRAGLVEAAQLRKQLEAPATPVPMAIAAAITAAIAVTVPSPVAVAAPAEGWATIAPTTVTNARAAIPILDVLHRSSRLGDSSDADLSRRCLGGCEKQGGCEQASRQCGYFEQKLSPGHGRGCAAVA